jgi:t-SNARE complex subunit (syntaxin)
MTYSRNDPVLHEIEEIDNSIKAAKEFSDLHRVCRKHLNDPFDQQTPQDVQLAYDMSWSMLKDLQKRLDCVKVTNGSDATRYRPQMDRLDRDLNAAFHEYNNIAAKYGRQEGQQLTWIGEIHDAIDHRVAGASQVSTLAVDLSLGSAALRSESDRNKGIKKLEWTIVDLARLWGRTGEMVIQQEPAVIESGQRVEEAVVHIGGGNREIDKGKVSARRRQSRKWWCFFITSKSFTLYSRRKLTSLKF